MKTIHNIDIKYGIADFRILEFIWKMKKWQIKNWEILGILEFSYFRVSNFSFRAKLKTWIWRISGKKFLRFLRFLRFLSFQPDYHFGPISAFLHHYQPKNQNVEKMKKTPADIIILHFMIICYTVHEIWHVTDVAFIFHFGQFFALSPPNIPKNCNSLKIKKMPGDIIILYMCINGQTDGQKKWYIEVGALTKKMKNLKLSQILVFHS